MKISLNHLNKLFNFNNINNIDLNQLIEDLSLSSCEIESLEFIKDADNRDNIVLDVISTANRSDLLSYLGIAREIAVLIKKQKVNLNLNIDDLVIPYQVTNFSDHKYLARVTGIITGIENYNSPLWLQNILSISGISISGDINDTIKYIMLETGFPLCLSEYPDENPGGEITTYIKMENPILDKKVKKLILKGMLLSAQNIRKLSKELNIKNEVTQRYERGLTLEHLDYSYRRAIYLIKKIHGASFGEVQLYHVETINQPIQPIIVNFNNIIDRLGQTNIQEKIITRHTILNILETLNFIIKESGSTVKITPPYYRQHDVYREIDVVEEIARIYGFNNFIDVIPRIKQYNELTPQEILFRKMRSRLRILGFNEFINYSLDSEFDVANTSSIQLQNPLNVDFSNLRQTLIYSILNNISYNLKTSNGLINGYEIGRLFNCKDGIYTEQNFLSLIITGNIFSNNWYNKNENIDWFYAKGIVEELFTSLSCNLNWNNENKELSSTYKPIFHSYNFSELFINEKYIGIFGQLNPRLLKEKNIKHTVYALEFNIEILLDYYRQNWQKNILYRQYSLYPYITRDITLNLHKKYTAKEVQEKIMKNHDAILTKVEIIGLYEGDKIQVSSKNISFRLYYQSNDRTLTVNEVDNVHNRIVEQLNSEFI